MREFSASPNYPYLGFLHDIESHLLESLTRLQRQNEIVWKQRSRVQWLPEGDGNTKFFHQVAKLNYRQNLIHYLVDIGGNTFHSIDQMKHHCHAYFLNMFSESMEEPQELSLPSLLYKCISDRDNKSGIAIPSEEIRQATFSLGKDPAPGPDGYNAAFYKSFWNIVGGDVCKMVKTFFASGSLPQGINETNTVLVRKKGGACRLEDFRPIRLCNVQYKIISNIIV